MVGHQPLMCAECIVIRLHTLFHFFPIPAGLTRRSTMLRCTIYYQTTGCGSLMSLWCYQITSMLEETMSQQPTVVLPHKMTLICEWMAGIWFTLQHTHTYTLHTLPPTHPHTPHIPHLTPSHSTHSHPHTLTHSTHSHPHTLTHCWHMSLLSRFFHV